MRNFLIAIALVTFVAFAANAQSKDCCSKEKGETTKLEKPEQTDQTVQNAGAVETSTTTAIVDGKETVKKDVKMTKMEMKGKSCDKSSCCEGKNEKKAEKEVEKK